MTDRNLYRKRISGLVLGLMLAAMAWCLPAAAVASPAAKPAACRSMPLTVTPGSNAYLLARRAGIGTERFMQWLHKVDAATRHRLTQLRAGDELTLCIGPGARLTSIRVRHRKAPTVWIAPSRLGRNHAAIRLDKTVLVAGAQLRQSLEQRLSNRRVVLAVVHYMQRHWHLAYRLPPGSRLVLARRADNHGLVYLELHRAGRHERVYHYVDKQGQHFVLGRHGTGLRLLSFVKPVHATRISSGWGWRTQPVLGGPEFHHGIDYAAPQGSPVYAAMDGVVLIKAWHGNYGRMIELKHADRLLTRYGHLSAYARHLKPGTHVRRGQIIGYVGSSGLSTGPHLYFEIWKSGRRVDPLKRVLTVDTRLSQASRRQFFDYLRRLSS